jgi:hypothetical protein
VQALANELEDEDSLAAWLTYSKKMVKEMYVVGYCKIESVTYSLIVQS